mmetsp:Transcript_9887/g.26251  ORF Transcript_9887/g.26251 Transcript_9887/m.26251 type:complete len:227 (-) Transcript_9887:137-817(-)
MIGLEDFSLVSNSSTSGNSCAENVNPTYTSASGTSRTISLPLPNSAKNACWGVSASAIDARNECRDTPGCGVLLPLCSTALSNSGTSGYKMATFFPVLATMPWAYLIANLVLAPAMSPALVLGSSMRSAASGGNSTSIKIWPSSIAATVASWACCKHWAMVWGGSARSSSWGATSAVMPSSPTIDPLIMSEFSFVRCRRGWMTGARAWLPASSVASNARCMLAVAT